MYKIVKIRDGEIVGGWLDELEAQQRDDLAFKHLLWNMTALHEAERQQTEGERPVFGRPIDADTASDAEIAGLDRPRDPGPAGVRRAIKP